MSRFIDGDGDSIHPKHWWRIDLERALASGRGQRILKDIERCLLTMPERKLIAGEIVRYDDESGDGAVCAVGAYALWIKVQGGTERQAALADLNQRWGGQADEWDTQELGRSVGLARTVAHQLGWVNDMWLQDQTDEARWESVLGWVRSKIETEAAS